MIRKAVTSSAELLAALQRLESLGGMRPEGPPPDFFKQFPPLHQIHARTFSKVNAPTSKLDLGDLAFPRALRRVPKVRWT